MKFNEYQDEALKTAAYPDIGNNYVYPVLGLTGEAGEVAEKVKKVIRDKQGIIDDETRASLKKELGDVLWYIAMLCRELGLTMDEVARGNVEKLRDRKNRKVIHGQGDNR
ncbi:MAG: nucleoside triphosphate pyrophosphohydrolase family protein [bacterium]|nr:nucleoside triphosphate pyrophosphohydrolase family protein [bacterium]